MIYYCGIDNGVSGQAAFLFSDGSYDAIDMPVKRELSYQKSKKVFIRRIDYDVLKLYFETMMAREPEGELRVIIERPMINSHLFTASLSAIRALESQMILLEHLGLSCQFIDSKKWQKELLPKGISGKELKKASMDVGIRLFPKCKSLGIKHKDLDGMLIAEYARRTVL